ncbi:MAG: Ig-like domain-containing protein, partial [Candidatus Saccharimonadales bacterium]
VAWTASSDSGGPGIGGYYVLRGGSQIASVGSSPTSYIDTSVQPNTAYSYSVEAFDTDSPPDVSAASSVAQVTTPSNSQPPTVTIASPSSGALVHGNSVSIDSSATPASGNSITQVQLFVNSSLVQTLTSSPYDFSLNTLAYLDGSYTLAVKATDNLGTSQNQTISVTITNGDINIDTKVSISDLSIMATNYGKTSGATYGEGDINGDGAVNVSDLSLLAKNYGISW